MRCIFSTMFFIIMQKKFLQSFSIEKTKQNYYKDVRKTPHYSFQAFVLKLQKLISLKTLQCLKTFASKTKDSETGIVDYQREEINNQLHSPCES